MPKLTVNGLEIEVPAGASILQACEKAGAEIPRFCYHEKLSVAGNCRMCLVEVEKAPKPVASCAMPAGEGMIVHTDTAKVKKAREGVMEFLLINHPLDCPICDQGGECDLQDQAMTYGRGVNRFTENKRSVPDKYMGPLIKTHMTRCIHCTRCIRFSEEVAGVDEIGAINRGEHMEITTYLEQAITSEMSGNLADICPVGALTSKPYAFRARNWELRSTESIDIMDACGSNIRVDAKSMEVIRILPRVCEEINEEWISDKTRYACDGLRLQRLDVPMIRKNGRLEESEWAEVIDEVKKRLESIVPSQVTCIAGDFADAETMYLLKKTLENYGCTSFECRQEGSYFDDTSREGYLFNTPIQSLEEIDALLIIGADPRKEATILNARIKKATRNHKVDIGLIGYPVDLTYDYEHLGEDVSLLDNILDENNVFAEKLKNAQKPVIIIGYEALKADNAGAILNKVQKIAKKFNVMRDDWQGVGILHRNASRVAALDLGFYQNEPLKNNIDTIYQNIASGVLNTVILYGADEIDIKKLENSYVVYIGHHGDKGAQRADVILPVAAYTEKEASYVNLNGLMQKTMKAIAAPGQAREDWQVAMALAKSLGQSLDFQNIQDLRLEMLQYYEKSIKSKPSYFNKELGKEEKLAKLMLDIPVKTYYVTDVISRASKTMQECQEVIGNASNKNAA